MARLAIRVKVVIFFGFVGYSLMIVDEFHFGLSRESELIAWVGVPIVLANLWLTGAQSRRFAMPTLTVWSAVRARGRPRVTLARAVSSIL